MKKNMVPEENDLETWSRRIMEQLQKTLAICEAIKSQMSKYEAQKAQSNASGSNSIEIELSGIDHPKRLPTLAIATPAMGAPTLKSGEGTTRSLIQKVNNFHNMNKTETQGCVCTAEMAEYISVCLLHVANKFKEHLLCRETIPPGTISMANRRVGNMRNIKAGISNTKTSAHEEAHDNKITPAGRFCSPPRLVEMSNPAQAEQLLSNWDQQIPATTQPIERALRGQSRRSVHFVACTLNLNVLLKEKDEDLISADKEHSRGH